MKTEKNKKFKLFDLNRDGKGVEEIEDRTPTLKFFFKLCKRKFSQLLQLNLLMLFQIIPLFVIFFVVDVYGAKTPMVTDALYAPLYGISKVAPSVSSSSLLDLVGIQMESTLYYTPVMTIVTVGMLLFLAITYGWQNVGAAYVLRGLVRGDAIFVFSDYFYGIRRNFKQAFFMGLLDFVCTALLVGDMLFLSDLVGTNFLINVMYFMIPVILVLYLVMRFYLYQLLITFDLSTFKIIKNALIFTVLGVKRNVMAVMGIAILIVLHFFLIFLSLSYGLSVFLVLPLIYILAMFGFISTYAAYPIIDRYMIAPYVKNDASEDELDAIEASEEA